MTATTVMDISLLMPWVAALLSVMALATAVKNFVGSGTRELMLKIELNEKKLIEHDRRIQTIEGELKHVPSKESVHKQQMDVLEIKGEVGIIKKSIETTERTTRRVEEFLLRDKDR